MPRDHSSSITTGMMVEIMKNTQRVMEANKEYLDFLDSEIGDAEHGATMVRGFRAVNERIQGNEYPDVASILRTTGMVFMRTAGGAAGPLYGTLYLKGAATISGRKEMDKKDLATFFQAGLSGVRTISGGTVVGDKTMIDALSPAVEVLCESLQKEGGEEEGLISALEKAVVAARKGMTGTIPLRAKKGRASYLGERSVGHQDPGATSTYLIFRTMLDTLKGDGYVKVARYEPNGMISLENILTN
jgi:phosphoenolpyruvate---glycerone phosphotransferase subunit DhaL